MTTRRSSRPARPAAPPPTRTVDRFLWDASNLAAEAGVFQVYGPGLLDQIQATLQQRGIALNDSQWAAWRRALGYRLTLIWGPPGTGKSQTLRALLAGLYLAAAQVGRPVRVLLSAVSYNAVDNVLRETVQWFAENSIPASIYRVISSYSSQLAVK